MKLFRIELEEGISKKLFYIDANQVHTSGLNLFKEKLNGHISIERTSTGYYIRILIDVPYQLKCDRCLSDFNDLKQIDYKLYLTDNDDIITDDSDDVIYFSKNENEFDLLPLLKEFIFLEVQMKNLCSNECKGICSNCGKNKNEENCNCFPKDHDNPWEILK